MRYVLNIFRWSAISFVSIPTQHSRPGRRRWNQEYFLASERSREPLRYLQNGEGVALFRWFKYGGLCKSESYVSTIVSYLCSKQ
jgi:hypothetical protein